MDKFTHSIIIDSEEGYSETRLDYSHSSDNPYVEIFVAAMCGLTYSKESVINLLKDYIEGQEDGAD